MTIDAPTDPLLERTRVLLVDDDEGSLELLSAILEPLVAELVLARSGEEALRLSSEGDFAVVLLDVGMPGLDGFETARRMKEDERGRRVPIIFLTGLAERSEIARGYSAGAVDYVLKPFEPEILRSKVQVFVDLFELRQRAALMTHRALHDQLTGLPNRTLFLDRLEMALARIGRTGKKLAVLFLDLDGFKHINDTLGHPAGDQMLIETAVALQQAIRAVDTAARFGGDEFVVLCEDIADAGEADAVAGRIFAQLERRTPPGGTRLRASIGIAVTGRPERAPEELIREADAAMLEAKSGPASR